MLVVALTSGYSAYTSQQKHELSDLALANVEATLGVWKELTQRILLIDYNIVPWICKP